MNFDRNKSRVQAEKMRFLRNVEENVKMGNKSTSHTTCFKQIVEGKLKLLDVYTG